MTTTIRAGGLILLALTAACAGESAEGPAFTLSDTAGIAIAQNILNANTPTCAVNPEPTLVIGAVEGAPEYQLYRTFGARRLSDGRIAVVNQGSQELRFYDSQGSYLMAAGRAGAGPGEFTDAFTLQALPGDTLWVGDYRPWEFEVFAPDGTWVRAVRPAPDYINTDISDVLDDGRLIMASRGFEEAPLNGFTPRTRTAILHRSDGTMMDTIGRYPNGLQGRFEDTPNFISAPMFDSSGRLRAGGSRMVLAHTSTPELRIHEVGDSVALSRIIRWSAETRPVTSADVEAERARIAETYADADPAIRQQLVDPLVREDRPVASAFPYFSTIEIGRDSRIWVKSYRMPGTTGPEEWLVFDPEGALQCRVTAEPFEQLPDFGSDYILVMRRDSLGVERIFQHSLAGPQAAVE